MDTTVAIINLFAVAHIRDVLKEVGIIFTKAVCFCIIMADYPKT